MKNFKLINLLLIVATSLLLVNCTTDPIPGPAGEDGVDGIDGVDGVSGTAECASCHNVANSEKVHASYLFSGHYKNDQEIEYEYPRGSGNLVPLSGYGNRNSCTSCHTSDGYIDWVETGMALSGDYPVYDGTQTITCNTCHNKHTSFDFEKDGYDAALRLIEPVTLDADPDGYVIDYEDEMTSHTCAKCHQPRYIFEQYLLDNGQVKVESRFGPHYGAQSVMLEGIQGAELAGYTYEGAEKSAAHRSGFPGKPSSCTICHMGESDNNVGKHTLLTTETSCVQCHTSGPPTEVAGLEEARQTLEDLLIAEGILEKDDDGIISIVSGDYDLVPAAALWNYRMLYYDHSDGVHNPKYAKSLIQNSIDALTAN